MRSPFAIVALLALSLSVSAQELAVTTHKTPQKSSSETPDRTVHVTMKNVDFHFSDSVYAHVESLSGAFTPIGEEFPIFDKKSSFAIDVESADISISLVSLSNDLNEYVFASPEAPLKNLKVSAAGNMVKLTGNLTGKGGLAFESQGTLTLAPDGLIRVHTNGITALHLPVKRLMDIFGMETSHLVNMSHMKGVTVDKDDLILDPQKALPPPLLKGHLTSVALRGDRILLTFSPEHASSKLNLRSGCGGKNFIAIKGGTVRFGKLTMDDSDLELVDTDSRDPFDFSIDHYKEQLEAGYSKITPKFGLCAYVPDLKKIGNHPARRAPATAARHSVSSSR